MLSVSTLLSGASMWIISLKPLYAGFTLDAAKEWVETVFVDRPIDVVNCHIVGLVGRIDGWVLENFDRASPYWVKWHGGWELADGR